MFTNQIDGNIRIQFAEAKHFFHAQQETSFRSKYLGLLFKKEAPSQKKIGGSALISGTCDCDRLVSVIT